MEFHVMSTTLNHHWCVGIDLHKDTLTACVYCRCCGEHSFKRIACKCRTQIAEFFAALPRPHTVAIETVGFYRWLWETLEPIVEKLVLADATQARALAGRRMKTDRVLCRAKSLMNANNRPGPERLQSDGLIRYLKAQGAKLPERHVAMLWDCIDQLALTERQIDQAERTIRELVQRNSFAAVYGLLLSFPGVAMVTAATVLGEIGDFKRFKDPKAIGRYAGLNPRVFASGGKQRLGHIAKTGSPHLRWILQQAAWTAIRTDDGVKRVFLRIAKRSGRKAAAVAIARKLLTWMWAAVVHGEPYQSRFAA
jgi:transposase